MNFERPRVGSQIDALCPRKREKFKEETKASRFFFLQWTVAATSVTLCVCVFFSFFLSYFTSITKRDRATCHLPWTSTSCCPPGNTLDGLNLTAGRRPTGSIPDTKYGSSPIFSLAWNIGNTISLASNLRSVKKKKIIIKTPHFMWRLHQFVTLSEPIWTVVLRSHQPSTNFLKNLERTNSGLDNSFPPFFWEVRPPLT